MHAINNTAAAISLALIASAAAAGSYPPDKLVTMSVNDDSEFCAGAAETAYEVAKARDRGTEMHELVMAASRPSERWVLSKVYERPYYTPQSEREGTYVACLRLMSESE